MWSSNWSGPIISCMSCSSIIPALPHHICPVAATVLFVALPCEPTAPSQVGVCTGNSWSPEKDGQWLIRQNSNQTILFKVVVLYYKAGMRFAGSACTKPLVGRLWYQWSQSEFDGMIPKCPYKESSFWPLVSLQVRDWRLMCKDS